MPLGEVHARREIDRSIGQLAKQRRELRVHGHAVKRKLNARAVRFREEAAILDCGPGPPASAPCAPQQAGYCAGGAWARRPSSP
jgi:hypothetical protein